MNLHRSHEALETYLDFLETSNSSKENHSSSTPCIDSVLHLYRQRNVERKGAGSSQVPLVERNGESYESRLTQLEEQLTALFTRSKGKQTQVYTSVSSPSTKGLLSDTDGSSPCSLKPKSKPHLSSGKGRQALQRRRYKVPERGRGRGDSAKVTSTREDRKKKHELLNHPRSSDEQEQPRLPSNQVLTLELDTERERRWKAEQAASRLVEHVRHLQSHVGEEKKRHELSTVREVQLEGGLEAGKRSNQLLQQQVQQLQDNARDAQQEIVALQERDRRQTIKLKELEESYRHLETATVEEHTLLQSQVRESERKAAGYGREVEVSRKSLKQNKAQIQQLQELLANREADHQKEKERWRPLDGKEIQDLISRQVQEERRRVESTVSQLQLKLTEKQDAYHALEDEFRMGLQIEAGRYAELEQSYQEMCGGVEATRQTAVTAVQKEKRAVCMVEELTSMVKEQKVKIKELSRSKQEMVAQLKERLSRLEAEMGDKNKIEARMLSLQEDRAKLESQVTAQLSVIDGLRDERKLWGKELAHQGASLAQERGRMEAQLEFLTQETGSLHQQLQKERDAVRVKVKQVEDQTHTIQQLKRATADVQTDKAGTEKDLQELKYRLRQEEASSLNMQDEVETLLRRKEELKAELASKAEERDQWRTKFNQLNSQWEQKVAIIGSLEESLQQLQDSFSKKEGQLVLEKDQASQSVRDCEQRLKDCDDAFRDQLEAKEKLYHGNLSQLAAEKDKEIHLANKKVESVEGEMRELLEEVAGERRNMESKAAHLSHVLKDLQTNLSNS